MVAIFQAMLGGHSILISLAVALHSRGFQASEGRCVWQSGGAGRGQVSQDLSELLARAPALLPGGLCPSQLFSTAGTFMRQVCKIISRIELEEIILFFPA